MPAAIRGIPVDILFRLGPRLKEEGFRWAPSTMLYHENSNPILQTIREGYKQGTPTPRGLLVQLSGYSLSFPARPRGLPPIPWNIITDENMFYMRDDEAGWHLVHRRWPTQEGDYLSNKKLCDIMRGDNEFWIVRLGTDFQARSDGREQTSPALLSKLAQDKDGVKYVNSYMHIYVGLVLQRATREMFEAAYQCSKKVAKSEPARHLANLPDDEVDMESPAYRAIFDALEPEICQIAASHGSENALAIARQTSGKDHSKLFRAIMGMIFIGHYVIMGPRTPATQQWCVN